MPIATTTPAGRAAVMRGDDQRLEENASQKLARKRAEAQRAAEALNDRPDTTTPLFPETVGAVPLATIPDPPAAPAPKVEKAARRFSLQTTIEHRGRAITIVCEGMTLDQFCDLLDERGYASPAPPAADPSGWQTLPDGTPICPKHRTPMRKRERQGDQWWSHNAGSKDAPLYCKGYHAPDSPGYEVD